MWRKGTEGNARQRPRPPRAPAPLSLRGALAGPSEDAPRHPAGHSSLTFLSATNPGPGAGQSRLFGPAALPTLRGAERITLGQKRVQPGPPGGPAPLLLGTTGLCTLAPGVSAGSRSCCVCRAGGAGGSACLGQPSATAGARGAQAAPSAQALRAPCTRRAAPHGLRLRSPPALSRPRCCLPAPLESLPWSGATGGPHTPRQGTVQSSAESRRGSARRPDTPVGAPACGAAWEASVSALPPQSKAAGATPAGPAWGAARRQAPPWVQVLGSAPPALSLLEAAPGTGS